MSGSGHAPDGKLQRWSGAVQDENTKDLYTFTLSVHSKDELESISGPLITLKFIL